MNAPLSGREAEALAEALDRMGEAVTMISAVGKVVYCNRAAERILREGVGVSLSPEHRLIAATGDARAMFAAALAHCLPLPAIAVPRLEQPPLVLNLQPLPPELQGAFGAVALLFISDPLSKPMDRTAALRSAYGLTEAEAKLVQTLSEGVPLKKIASANQITYETARTHLRRILAKTGARRQAELVRITHALR
ncbi:MAG TPA: helix-turn-helix transcriptional regulator [Nevskiaceae bacterium]|nr:helix-turn-helix transcriptional regulator [Nevskiaceae bacterium]